MTRRPLITYTYDPTQLSWAELLEAAELTGVDPTQLDTAGFVAKTRYTATLAWIYNRADNPELTIEDVMAGRVGVAENGTIPPEPSEP